MTRRDLFDNRHKDLFMPDGVEFIYNVLQGLGFVDFTTKIAREKGLEAIQILLELGLIEVFNWGDDHHKLKDIILSNKDLMKYIERAWFLGANFSDFYGMPMFKYKDWYLSALKKEGLTSTTDWKTFVDEKIGDLEKWIEENRPKLA